MKRILAAVLFGALYWALFFPSTQPSHSRNPTSSELTTGFRTAKERARAAADSRPAVRRVQGAGQIQSSSAAPYFDERAGLDEGENGRAWAGTGGGPDGVLYGRKRALSSQELVSRFNAERTDLQASHELSQYLLEIAKVGAHAVQQLDVSCRTTVCRVSVLFDSHEQARRYLGDAAVGDDSLSIQQIEDDEQRVRPIVFMQRRDG